MYSNLLIFLAAIFLFSVESVPQTPWLPGWQSFMLFLFSLIGYGLIAKKVFAKPETRTASGYFRAEKQLSIIAVIFFGGILYSCDPKYYLSILSLGKTMPALVNFAGLLLFLLFLSLMWAFGQENYQYIFGREYRRLTFIANNIKANLPIVLPWIILSLLYDITALLPFPGLQKLLASEWGDLLLFAVFLLFVVIFFPPLVRRLWGCRPLPDGYLKNRLDVFCATLKFSSPFYLWPLFEGRVLTAGVIGIIPGLRYILLTPALIETMTQEEIEAIVAHEIGHVQKYHLLLYIVLIGGFSLLSGMLALPLGYLLLSQEFFSKILVASDIAVDTILATIGAAILLACLLIYFRFIFGYFIRNFERQADLYSLATIGNARAMISAFEKIDFASGGIREERNWHHFGIGERITCLEEAEQNPGRIKRHDRKVRLSLFGYGLVLLFALTLVYMIPKEDLAQKYQENFAETVLLQKVRLEPDHAVWQRMMGDLMLTRKMEDKALAAYEKALSLEPTNPEIMNNYAWLLLTSDNRNLRDPFKALTLARAAATLNPKGHVLDTLATAYWANGLTEEAVTAEKHAIFVDMAQRRYYLAQIRKFTSQPYEETVGETAPAPVKPKE